MIDLAKEAEFSPQRSFASPEFLPDTGDRHNAGGKLVVRRD
jgi:hypothetical protein